MSVFCGWVGHTVYMPFKSQDFLSTSPRGGRGGSVEKTGFNPGSSSVTMVAIAVTQAFRLAVVSKGGEPSGAEDALIQEVRDRFKLPVSQGDAERCALFAYGMAPLARYGNVNILPLASLAPDKYAESVYDLLELAAKHTFILRRFDGIINSEASWLIVTGALAQMQQGMFLLLLHRQWLQRR